MAPEIALVYCAGGNPAFRRVAADCGWLNGARLPDTVYDPPLFFADQEWKEPDRAAYMDALAKWRPRMATVLDLECDDQLGEVLSWAEEAALYVGRVVIIPKACGAIERLPRHIGGKEVVLGYSVPTGYGGTGVPVWEFRGWPVHLLGGSPQAQRKVADYLDVVSLDGSMTQMQALRGRFWSRKPGPKGHWVQLSETGDTRPEGAHLECFRRSLVTVREMWLDRAKSLAHCRL